MGDLGAQIPYLQIGLLMVVALVGVYLAGRFRQSLIIAYILVGLLIGPNLGQLVPIGGYTGVVHDEGMIRTLLELGLVFMFLFVGLEFSITRLRETRKASSFLAITHVSTNLFVGFLLGTWLGWPLLDTLFLAVVVASSSAAVAMKSLRELGLLRGKEVRFIVGEMVVEDFILIVVFAFASGVASLGVLTTTDVFRLGFGVVLLYAFFIILGFWIVPRAYVTLAKVRNADMFILLALALVFLAGAFALLLGEYPAFGTFFMGLALAETPFGRRLVQELEAIRNGFTAIFFISFGMLIKVTPGVLSILLPMLLIIVPLIIINEVLLVGGIGYLLGFRGRSAVTIGSSLCGRGEDSLLYASIGESLLGERSAAQSGTAAHSAVLFSFAGVFSFLMTALAMPMIKHAHRFVGMITRALPRSMKFAGAVIHATFHQAFFETRDPDRTLDKVEMTLFVAGIGYIAATIALLLSSGVVHLVLTGVSILSFGILYWQLARYVRVVFSYQRLSDLNLRIPDYHRLQTLIVRVAAGLLAPFLGVAALYPYLGLWTVLVPAVVVVALSGEMEDAYRKTMRHLGPLPKHHKVLPSPPDLRSMHKGRTPAAQLPKGGRGPLAGSPSAPPPSALTRALRGEDRSAAVPARTGGSSQAATGRDCSNPIELGRPSEPRAIPLAADAAPTAASSGRTLGLHTSDRMPQKQRRSAERPRGVASPRSMRGLDQAARPRTLRGRGWGAAARYVVADVPHPPSMSLTPQMNSTDFEPTPRAPGANPRSALRFDRLGNRPR